MSQPSANGDDLPAVAPDREKPTTTSAISPQPSSAMRWVFIVVSIGLAAILLVIFAEFIYSLFTLNSP